MRLKFLGITVSSLVNSNQNTQLCQIWSNMKMSNYPAKNEVIITALFNNTRTLKIKSSTDKCVFPCRQSSVRRVLPAYDYCRTLFVVWTLHIDLITARSAAVESWEEPANIWLTVAKDAFVGWALNFRVRMLLKDAVNNTCVQSWT